MSARASLRSLAVGLPLLLFAACGGGGGGSSPTEGQVGGGGPNQDADPSTTTAGLETKTYATAPPPDNGAGDGAVSGGFYGQHDVLPGGQREDDPYAIPLAQDQVLRDLYASLKLKQTDLDADLVDGDFDGIADPGVGLEAYGTGSESGPTASARIFAANNIYDLFQTTTGSPRNNAIGVPIDGSAGGPGLFANVPNTIMPKLFSLPNAMGQREAKSGSGRGPSPTDEHQFIQVDFPYDIDPTSIFNPENVLNSFLGDSLVGNPTDNVRIEARWVQQDTSTEAEVALPVDQSFQHRHVSGIGILGTGTSAITSIVDAGGNHTVVDLETSNLPAGAKQLLFEPNVFTYVAHENPNGISETSAPDIGYIDVTTTPPTLILPDPTDLSGFGGRVFGANADIPSSVNDFLSDGDTDAAIIGFFSVDIRSLRTSGGEELFSPYFHSFDMSQDYVGDPDGDPTVDIDPRAPFGIASFNRGPAVYVDALNQLPEIDILDPSQDVIGGEAAYNPLPTTDVPAPAGDGNVVSTRARFLVRFDKEVVPNSVGQSRRHTIQRTSDLGVVYNFQGNVRPVQSPAGQFVAGGEGSPWAPSIYLCVNQPAQRKTNAPDALAIQANNPGFRDDGTPVVPGLNGLDPQTHNTLAEIPRSPVPCDIYPLSQNNLNAYVIEPLLEIPPNSVVTLGVCVPGLNISGAALQGGTTNRGNNTRSGTRYTPFQGLTPTGLGADVSNKTSIIGDQTIIKVNPGPMDFQGNLFYGSTAVSINTLIDGDLTLPDGTVVSNDNVTGMFNVSRSFQVGDDGSEVYVNAPVSPMALYAGYTNGGMGIVDLNGTGFNTNAPGGGLENVAFKNYLICSTFLPLAVSGSSGKNHWVQTGAFPTDHGRAFGLLSRYTSGGSQGTPPGTESDLAIGAPIPTGNLTPQPGINEGSSGFETMVSDSTGNKILTDGGTIGVVRDLVVGEFIDSVFFDGENTFAPGANHRTIFGTTSSVANNTIADPPLPNPPPLRYPVGLPHTAIEFNQDDLSARPFTIEGNEVFSAENFVSFNVGGGNQVTASAKVNGLIQLNPTFNQSNQTTADQPPLPNAGYANPFGAGTLGFVQTGPMPQTSTAPALTLVLNAAAGFQPTPNGIIPADYQARQQIGNFLFVADGTNKKVHAVNSNTMEVVNSVSLPDPFGLGLSSDLNRLFVSNEGDNSLSLIDADPRSATFMKELNRVDVGIGPRGVSCSPDQEDVFVLNFLGNTISIVDMSDMTLRRTLSDSGINRPWDMAVGMREVTGAPGFQSGVFHGYISNFGGDNVLIYQSGPTGLAGIGFDSIIGTVTPQDPPPSGGEIYRQMVNPRGVVYDPTAPLDAFAGTVGCYVAHKDENGFAMVSRIAYSKDDQPGQQNTNEASPGFGTKVFEVVDQFISPFTGEALDVALIDYTRRFFEEQTWGGAFPNLFNTGSVLLTLPGINLPRNAKYPLAGLSAAGTQANNPRWQPDILYLSITGGRIVSFDVFNPQGTPGVIETPRDVRTLTSYFSQ